MLELKGITGVLYTMSEWVMRLSAVNLMWFGLSLPFFVLLLTVDMSSSGGLAFFGVAAWVFVSFLVFPATAAVFSVARAWIVEFDYSSVTRKYLIHLKREYKADAKMGTVFAFVWLLWYYGYFYFYAQKSSLSFFFLLAGLALFVYTINFLCISVHYQMTGKDRMKNAFFISAGRPLAGLFILASSGALLWISITQLLLLLPLLSCSLIAFLSFSAFHRVTQKIGEKSASNKSA